MQIRTAVVMMAAALLLGGCTSGGDLFRDRSERGEAARLLLQREADKERALREAEAEAEAARREKDERAEKAQREADEEAERRKREEAADLEQERRHRRERKEAEHDAEIRELHKGSAAPAPGVERYLIAMDKWAAARTEYAHELSYCVHSSETPGQLNECYKERVHRLDLKADAAEADAWKAGELMPGGNANVNAIHHATRRGVFGEVLRADSARLHAEFGLARSEAYQAYDDALAAWRAAPSHSDADEVAAFHAAKRRLFEANRAWADAAVAEADARRAWAAAMRAAVEANPAAFAPPDATRAAPAAQNAQPAKAPQNAAMDATP